MKTQNDPRHLKRESKFKKLFSFSFNEENFDNTNESNVKPILKSLAQIDQNIQQAAPEWPVVRLNKVDLAILRLAVFELLVEDKEPPKVIIDEAVEIAKLYGSHSSAKFVNGVLGTILKQKKEKNN